MKLIELRCAWCPPLSPGYVMNPTSVGTINFSMNHCSTTGVWLASSWGRDLLSIVPRRSAARCSTALAWRAIDAHEEFARFSPILSILLAPVSVLDGG